jgi:uncharacterized membrane protein required for colicin V production
MSQLGGFNWLDALVLFLLFASLLVGYTQGVLRQLIGLVALYVGAILGAQYHTLVGSWFRVFLTELPSRFVNGLAFFTIVIVVTSIVTVLALDAYQSFRVSIYPVFDHLGGAIVSLFTIVLAITLCLPVLSFTTLEMWPTMEPARLFVDEGLRNSNMLVLFETLKPLLLSALSPWLPGGLPSIFNL